MIESYRFGQIRVNGKTYTSDIMIQSGKVIPNWWRREGHRCSFEDIASYLTPQIKCFILGTGAYGMLQPDRSLVNELKELGIEFIARPTAEAIKVFNNRLAEQQYILAGFHLTC